MSAKIFIIEDEPIAVKNIAKILKDDGYEIAGIANNCQKASEMINAIQPDLVVCNLYLKFVFSGKSIVKLIRSVNKVPFIFLSSFTHDSRMNDILRTKSEIYLCSPYTSEQLLSSVKRLLNNFSRQNNSGLAKLLLI